MDSIQLEASRRETGSSASKKIRKEGFVPCVLYGHDVDPVHFKIKETDLHPIIYTKELFQVEVELNGDSWECILKDLDYHPVTDHPIHVDFQVLHPDRPIKVSVPVTVEGVSEGQDRGGELVQLFTEVDLKALPEDIPSQITVNVEELDIGDSIHVDDLEVPGAEILLDGGQTVVSVVGGRLEIVGMPAEEPEVEEAELEEGELPEGEEALEEGEAPPTPEEGEEGEAPEPPEPPEPPEGEPQT